MLKDNFKEVEARIQAPVNEQEKTRGGYSDCRK